VSGRDRMSLCREHDHMLGQRRPPMESDLPGPGIARVGRRERGEGVGTWCLGGQAELDYTSVYMCGELARTST
jgi:hypothetical protein